jgi:hypothetical protein
MNRLLKTTDPPPPPPPITHHLDLTSYLTQFERNILVKICSSFHEFKHRVTCEYPFYEPTDTHLILFSWPFLAHLPQLLLYNRKFLVQIRKLWSFIHFPDFWQKNISKFLSRIRTRVLFNGKSIDLVKYIYI